MPNLPELYCLDEVRRTCGKHTRQQNGHRLDYPQIQNGHPAAITVEANNLITFEGVRFDSHKWFMIAPFQVDRNFVNCSDRCSVSDEKPAVPTRIKCCMCLGYYKNEYD